LLINHKLFSELNQNLEGSIHTDKATRSLYATDASIYRELPIAVAYPKVEDDIKKLIEFATQNKLSLIPRTAGTSLAGQCVGAGIVVDVSKYFTKILEVNKEEGWVRLQPGVVRDELNIFLKPYGLYFGPNTSTANRAMIGGMVGNNSCGSYSIVYGDTRRHTLEIKAIMYDGSEALFKENDEQEFQKIILANTAQSKVYNQLYDSLKEQSVQEEIKAQFPKASIHRRNTGYAIDEMILQQPFNTNGEKFNLSKLIAGSEGSLCFMTEIKIHVDPLPPKETRLICAQFMDLNESLEAVVSLMELAPRALELMDYNILECTKGQIEYSQYRFFVEGEPQAILIIEIGEENEESLNKRCDEFIQRIKEKTTAYAYPTVSGATQIRKVWKLREAGLGLLSNFPGDAKPVAVIEDTAVELSDLPAYIDEFGALMKSYNQTAVYYAHAGAGELHIRPVLNLKQEEGVTMLRTIATASAHLVKKYHGSLSGEHGDGRLRGEFIPLMIGEKNYVILKEIKKTWDPNNIFNPGKIVDTPPMDTSLRYEIKKPEVAINTIINFDSYGGILRASEKCNGSGDCRKTEVIGGTMCPSYMATRNEKDTTRARANILREFLTNSDKKNKFNHEEIKEVLDLCLSCKGCKSECPSNVDMALLKAEFLYQYQQENGAPLSSWAMAHISTGNMLGAYVRPLTNFLLTNKFASSLIKNTLDVASERQLPKLYKYTLSTWFEKNKHKINTVVDKQLVYVFVDEFSEYNDVEVGIKTIELLSKLGYKVAISNHANSGRAYISKGFLKDAKRVANKNIRYLTGFINEQTPLIGIEPSCILGFRDEYPRLVDKELIEDAHKIAKYSFTIDEFLYDEYKKGTIGSSYFNDDKKPITLHGHCHQKAMSDINKSTEILEAFTNTKVTLIPSGCCGMAGSFGYEKKHYEVSMQVGELVLFPAVRKAKDTDSICASGTSCRHQIKDGTGVDSKHIAEILWERLK
jgi:FAD/FMN-containing dehydrogenase/Fe-S oxidoreductase